MDNWNAFQSIEYESQNILIFLLFQKFLILKLMRIELDH